MGIWHPLLCHTAPQDDMQQSLRARVELMVEDALSWQEEQQAAAAEAGPGGAADQATAVSHPLLKEGPLSKGCALALPQRVLMPWEVSRPQ